MEFWALAGLAVGSQVIGGAMQNRASRRAQEQGHEFNIEERQEQGRQDRETLRYQGELGDYWRRKVTQDRRTARANMFDKYSKIAQPQGFQRAPLVTGEAPVANPTPVTTPTTGSGTIAVPRRR